jgi:hypothetical protein
MSSSLTSRISPESEPANSPLQGLSSRFGMFLSRRCNHGCWSRIISILRREGGEIFLSQIRHASPVLPPCCAGAAPGLTT